MKQSEYECPCSTGPIYGLHEGSEVLIDCTGSYQFNPIFLVCEKHKHHYDKFMVKPGKTMEQSEYKCLANEMYGQHEGPENYMCGSVSSFDKKSWPICEKHATGKPYG